MKKSAKRIFDRVISAFAGPLRDQRGRNQIHLPIGLPDGLVFIYKDLTCRNAGYIAGDVQERIRTQRLLIAGCGIGSQIAIAAVRIGFERFVLVDGDRIEVHNLNRQAFDFGQVKKGKAEALAEQMRRINPNVEIHVHNENLGPENAATLVASCDFVIDTIDFLDMNALLLLHSQAVNQKKPAISSFAVGWGAAAMYFPNHDGKTDLFRKIFIGDSPITSSLSYVQKFQKLFELISAHLNPTVVQVMNNTFQSMIDNCPCPAPQVAAGAYAVAAVVTTLLTKIIAGEKPREAPELILFDLWTLTEAPSIRIEFSKR